MHHIPRMSEAVYVGLCHEIGSPTEVGFRREVMDTDELVNKSVHIKDKMRVMKSGSIREGFRLTTSDEDWMYWSPKFKVICDPSHISLYRIPHHTVILMICEDAPPGFTTLKFLRPSNNPVISASGAFAKSEFYISSTLFRDFFSQFIKSLGPYFASSVTHGPCSATIKKENFEGDLVVCFHSPHCPTIALPWIQRCHQQCWPSEIILSDILRGGFHVVPIGSTPDNGEEWRISFSYAEQKLVIQ